jgi:mannosyltransferase OCH1-like enzyme
MIPKLIHQIWFQDNNDVLLFSNNLNKNFNRIFSSDIPYNYKFNLLKFIIHNSEYTYCLWNETKIFYFIKIYYPNLLPNYLNLKYKIQKVDFAKYIILFHYGGIYTDIDIESYKSINNFFKINKNEGIYFSKTSYINNMENCIMKKFYNFKTNNYFINNGIILASPHHNFFLDVIKDIEYNIANNNDYFYNSKIFNTTGPSMLTNSILKHNNKYNDIYILNNEYFEPCYGKDVFCKITKKTILMHQHKSSWLENLESNSSFFNFIFHSFFSIVFDNLTMYYFLYLRGYKFLYFVIVFLIYDYNKN